MTGPVDHPLRQLPALYLLGAALALQAVCAAELLAGPLPAAAGRWAVFALGPLAALGLGLRRAPGADAAFAARWLLAGLVCFSVWAGLYFAVAAAVAPERYVYLSGELEAHIPLVPAASAIYACVDPLVVLPFLVLREPDRLQRLTLGAAGIALGVALVWALYPVATPAVAPPPGEGFGAWALGLYEANDPRCNCLPSTHCAMALHAAPHLRAAGPRWGAWALATALAIGVATLLTKQHYLVDVASGYALGAAAFAVVGRLGPR